MDESVRVKVDAGAAAGAGAEEDANAAGEQEARREARTHSGVFVADAMNRLFQSAEVSITRGDETRVIDRSWETGTARQNPLPSGEGGAVEGRPPTSSPPAEPRVDPVLWAVMIAGLLAITATMLYLAF
ncbi:MAG: hypothetical protein OEZ06_31360 [Myxococcales bacterium]|nr:hypothetical protein [Myxococcales bacterium]